MIPQNDAGQTDGKPNESTLLSSAIKRHLTVYPFWTDRARAGILADVGEAGERVIQEALDFAFSQEEWLRLESLEAFQLVKVRLSERYPDLDAEAIDIIANMTAYLWR